jgi:hypothetical protein
VSIVSILFSGIIITMHWLGKDILVQERCEGFPNSSFHVGLYVSKIEIAINFQTTSRWIPFSVGFAWFVKCLFNGDIMKASIS